MTYLEACICSLEKLNTFVSPRILRAYQRDLLLDCHFTAVSPLTGQAASPAGCHVINLGDPAHGNIGIAYRMGGKQPWWLLASGTKDGFPITEVYFPRADDSPWYLTEAFHRENVTWRAELRELELSVGQRPDMGVACREPTLLIGHPNFAHHLWNELPALYAFSKFGGGTTLQVRALYEPLLPVGAILAGRLPSFEVTRVTNLAQLTGLQEQLVTRLGATRIPAELREDMLKAMSSRRREKITGPIFTTLATCAPVVWLSVRADARTANNQQDFLINLLTCIVATYPKAGFILDGFSYPEDFDHPVYNLGGSEQLADGATDAGFLHRAMAGREAEVSRYIRQLQEKMAGRVFENPVVSVSGMRLADVISLAGRADYYVCHAGTLQHKIAWLYDTPGIIHTNTAGLRPGAARWLADQVEGARKPSLLSAQLVRDLDSIRTVNRVQRNRDYHFVDIDAAVDEVLADMRRVAV